MEEPLTFGHFEVLTRSDGSPQVLGRGGMGVTYKALDRNLLSWVVIKMLGPQHEGTPGARQRFLQEARLMARLRHPHVASVFYFGESDAGAFYAMEFCEGPTLQEFVEREGPLHWKEVFRLGLQAASALQALEALELVHRDLKPSNMILTRDSAGSTQVKLIDFGVAREGAALDGGVTQGGFVGTPLYASPEQLLEAGNLDARSDFYSLGAMLWFAMTGRPPFEGTAFEVMFHHVNSEPDWSRLPEMPEPALLLMKRLLGKSAQERPENPNLLCAELQKQVGEQSGAPLQLPMLQRKKEEGEGGYEMLEERPGDGFGHLWRTRDVLTGRIVALRVMPSQFSARQGLVLRAQRLAACVRGVEHEHWQRVWHFEQNGDECRLATQWVAGPNLLALLKARQSLGLPEALPLLAQVAEAMDFGVSVGLSTMDTALERIMAEVDGWEVMGEEDRAQWLRQPMGEKSGGWKLKMCPMRLGLSPHDYVLPTDAEAGQAAARMVQDFVQLCFRLLSGQGREGAGYVPSPALKAEGNAFFEKRMGANALALGVSGCRHQLSLLCLAEGVSAGHLLDDGDDGLATRVVTGGRRPASDTTLIVGSAGKFKGAAQSAGVTMGVGATAKLRDLDLRRQKLDQEAEQLRAEGRLEAEREWIAREREELENARSKIAAQEAERNERVQKERERLEEQRRAVEQQQALLEEKRQEQLRLEQELQARAQQEFQRLQEEARSRESQWQHQRAEAEEALKQREADFLAREGERIAKLESLKQESASLEQHVQQEARALHDSQLKQDRLVREKTFVAPVDPTLEDFLNNRYAVVAKLPALSAAHQRYELRSATDSSARFVLSYCPYQRAPGQATLDRQKKLATLMMSPTLALLCQAVEFHFATDYHFVISGFPGEQSLREVLQSRRALPVTEAEPFLRLLAEACEAAVSLGWPRLSLKTQDLYLDSRLGLPRVALPDVPVFDAVGFEAESGDPMRTKQFSVSDLADWNDPIPRSAGEYVSVLAELCCELLGHPQNTRRGNARFQPIAQLSSQQNMLLRKALANDLQADFSSARAFLEMFFGQDGGFDVSAHLEHLRAVAEAESGLTPKPPPLLFGSPAGPAPPNKLEAPASPPVKESAGILAVRGEDWNIAGQSSPVTRVRLIPQSEETTALALVADEGISLGRSMTDADFVAQFRPRSARNDTRSRRIGRAQAQVLARNDRIGFEEKAPLNPSLSGENGLPIESPAEFSSPGAILLAGEYPLEVHRVPTAYPKGRQLSIAAWHEASAPEGSLVARPGGPDVLLWETALLLSDVGLQISTSGRAHFQVNAAQETAARFHQLNGQFWIEVVKEGVIKSVDGKPVQAHQMLLLCDDMKLGIGRHVYSVHCYSLHAPAGASG